MQRKREEYGTRVYTFSDVWGQYTLAISGRVPVLTSLQPTHPRGKIVERQSAANLLRAARRFGR